MQFKVDKIEDWQTVAHEIAKATKHNILLLKGDLGAGKTTFTKFFIKELGSDDEASSPTYSIVNEYNTSKGKIFHFDLYRMKSIAEVYDIGIEEYLDNAYFCIIEWAEIYQEELDGSPYHQMSIEYKTDFREVHFQ